MDQSLAGIDDFYSHAREGRDQYWDIARKQFADFYSHAREGRDNAGNLPAPCVIISTHTPARGVTPFL